MCLVSGVSPRVLLDAAVLHAGLDAETGWWICFWQHQHWIYQATHAAVPGEELNRPNKCVAQIAEAKFKLQQSVYQTKQNREESASYRESVD